MKKYMVGIRTNKWDFQNFFIASYYMSHGIHVALVVDEVSGGKLDTSFIPKVALTEAWMQQHKLLVQVPKIGWRCGDYCFYAMMQQYPDFDGYWLVEDDALMLHQNLKEILQKCFDQDFDFLAAHLGKRRDNWIWFPTVADKKDHKNEVKGCSFGVSFMSKRLCQFLFAERQRIYDQLTEQKRTHVWPADEAFVMNYTTDDYLVVGLEKVIGAELFENYLFTGFKKYFEFNESRVRYYPQGFYHPVVINNGETGFFMRKLTILKRQHSPEFDGEKDSILAKVMSTFNRINLT